MSIKKIAVCTGFDENEQPTWQTKDIGAQSDHIIIKGVSNYNDQNLTAVLNSIIQRLSSLEQ